MLATGATRPVLVAVAETLLRRAGTPARCAFYEDSPYVSSAHPPHVSPR
ncbi:hypothetical protein [Streptomyces turgidiscabies]|uniref:Uncharacterized protein n=1 Tax=Streptomyces turgidiscabies TaxID=85558 RepID=A0ABU0RZM1_9ACTN|nr:hypothetical protein [Streptomyces turgidiscabies]MDQ0937435.1 hypothetical protein [Streptomyces turgidiscabies]